MRYAVVEKAVKIAAPVDSRERRILLETIRYYYEHPRAASELGCEYEDESGNVCAVGRCMLAKERRALAPLDNGVSVTALAESYPKENIDPILKAKYRGLSMDFWISLQRLHDSGSVWNRQGARGMTIDGAYYAIRFATDFCPGSTSSHHSAAYEYLGEEA